jgi:NAD(P)-dependent dehydrogenase (short-subunit alcohol dehydrogenase family)
MGADTLGQQFSLSGRTFVVTGASSGLGRAMAGFIAEAGARVILVARRAERLAEACKEIDPVGPCRYVAADLEDRENLQRVANDCLDAFGDVDGVINAAGVNPRQPAEEVSLETWDKTLNVNLATPFFFSRCFIEGMCGRGFGRIINIASLQSSRAFPNGLPYGASKAGICQLTRAMSEAWSSYGITCNAIAPGFFPTELTAAVFDDPNTRDWAANQTTIGRNGELEDLFGATVFFASPASSYITGQTLYVDGGFTAK